MAFNFDDQNKRVIYFFILRCFLKEMESVFSLPLSSYRNTRESFGEAEETLVYWLMSPQHFSFFQTSTRGSVTR